MSEREKGFKEVSCDLKGLFKKWAEDQSKGNEKCIKKTFPCGKTPEDIPGIEFKSSFCADGYSSLNGYHDPQKPPKIEVLFILKESNLYDKKTASISPEENWRFWFNSPDDKKDRVKETYKNKIRIVLDKLYEERIIEHKYTDDTPFGYMNINKRGGYGHTDMSRLTEYAHKYEKRINQQIGIMKPKVIVCSGCFDLMKSIIKYTPDYMLDLYHLSYRGFLKNGQILKCSRMDENQGECCYYRVRPKYPENS